MRDANNTKVGYTALCAIPLPPRSRSKGPPSSSSFSGPGGWGGAGGPGIARAHGGRRMRRRRRRRRRRGGRREEEEEGIIYPCVLVGGGPRPSAPSVNSVLYQMNLGMAGGRSNILLFFFAFATNDKMFERPRGHPTRGAAHTSNAAYGSSMPTSSGLAHTGISQHSGTAPPGARGHASQCHPSGGVRWGMGSSNERGAHGGGMSGVRERPPRFGGGRGIPRSPANQSPRSSEPRFASPGRSPRGGVHPSAQGEESREDISRAYRGRRRRRSQEEVVFHAANRNANRHANRQTNRQASSSSRQRRRRRRKKRPGPCCLLPSSCAAGACSGGKKEEE